MNKEILNDFLESDIQGSSFIIKEILDLIKKAKKNNSVEEFFGNSFELKIGKDKVFLFNEFNEEKTSLSLEDFEKILKKNYKKDFLDFLKKS